MRPLVYQVKDPAHRSREQAERGMHKMLHIDDRNDGEEGRSATPEGQIDGYDHAQAHQRAPAKAPQDMRYIRLMAQEEPDEQWDDQQNDQVHAHCQAEQEQGREFVPASSTLG